jgi:uncharacterized membrane protein YfcA
LTNLVTFLALGAVACVVGLLIGAVGIGGVLLIPALTVLGGLGAHTASATALATFLFTGLLGTWLFQRRGSIDWAKTTVVCVAATLFSAIGAVVAQAVSPLALTRIVALCIVFAGSYVFLPVRSVPAPSQGSSRERALLAMIGAAAGFGSGLSGAGGPLFSVPLMMIFGFPPLMAIGTSQALQVISAGAGTAANLHFGAVDVPAVLWVTGFELAGVLAGAKIAHIASPAQLRKGAAVLCLLVGAAMLVRTL